MSESGARYPGEQLVVEQNSFHTPDRNWVNSLHSKPFTRIKYIYIYIYCLLINQGIHWKAWSFPRGKKRKKKKRNFFSRKKPHPKNTSSFFFPSRSESTLWICILFFFFFPKVRKYFVDLVWLWSDSSLPQSVSAFLHDSHHLFISLGSAPELS